MNAVQERNRQRRADRLAEIAAQLAAGTLVIRPMTAAEREFWGPPKDLDGGKARRRRAREGARS